MWLPHRLYEAVPTICLAIGGMFVVGALYIGFETRSALLYLLASLSCIAYGASIMWLRHRYRRPRPGLKDLKEETQAIEAAARQVH
jgi:hypothetical protein